MNRAGGGSPSAGNCTETVEKQDLGSINVFSPDFAAGKFDLKCPEIPE